MTPLNLEKVPKREPHQYMRNAPSNVWTWLQVSPSKRQTVFKHVIARNSTIQGLKMRNFIYEWKTLIYFPHYFIDLFSTLFMLISFFFGSGKVFIFICHNFYQILENFVKIVYYWCLELILIVFNIILIDFENRKFW